MPERDTRPSPAIGPFLGVMVLVMAVFVTVATGAWQAGLVLGVAGVVVAMGVRSHAASVQQRSRERT
jgi:hypothetical protein